MAHDKLVRKILSGSLLSRQEENRGLWWKCRPRHGRQLCTYLAAVKGGPPPSGWRRSTSS